MQKQTSIKVYAEDSPGYVTGFVTETQDGTFAAHSVDTDTHRNGLATKEDAITFLQLKRKEVLRQRPIGGMYQRGNKRSKRIL